jgi:hypothetical protein
MSGGIPSPGGALESLRGDAKGGGDGAGELRGEVHEPEAGFGLGLR